MTVQPFGPDARERAILHDLRNQLAIISGSAELAADQLEPGIPAHDRLQGILAAVRTGHDLLRELSECLTQSPPRGRPEGPDA